MRVPALPRRQIHDHSFLAEELLIPNVDKTDAGRSNMFTAHQSQLLVPNTGEPPRVFTNFENEIGKYSSGLRCLKEGTYAKVVDVVEFHDMKKMSIISIHDSISDEIVKYDIIEMKDAINLTEYYGYERKYNPSLDKKKSVIREGDFLYRNGMYDENLNFQYGVNLKAIYLPYKGLTYEDGIVISESAAKKLGHTSVEVFDISLNTNDVLINLFGDESEYKPLPSIGEEFKHYLAARRRLNYATALINFDRKSFMEMKNEDTIFYANGTVVDIEVFSNLEDDEFARIDYLHPFFNVFTSQLEAYMRINDIYEKLREKHGSDIFSDDFNFWYRKGEDALRRRRMTYDKKEFDGILVRVTVKKEVPVVPGAKLTGRHGNKGTISRIIPDKDLPKVEETGEVPDILLNPLGVIGRKNVAQNYEQELNFIANDIRKKCTTATGKLSMTKFKKMVMDFYRISSPEYYKFLENTLEICSKEDQDQFFKNAWKDGLFIHQPPFFNNITIDAMIELYDTFKTEKIKFEGVETPLVFGEIYFLILKHLPSGKYSVRSGGKTSLLDIPYKTNMAYKSGNDIHNSNPIRMGEQELLNFMLLDKPAETKFFLQSYSSSKQHRTNMNEMLLTMDINKIDSFYNEELDGVNSNSTEVVRAMFKGLGLTLEPLPSDDEED